jgi:uncharacterized OB-fold protein
VSLGAAAERPARGVRPRVRRSPTALVGSACRACGVRSWPGRAVCHRCGSPELEEVELARTGVLETYTTVHVARPLLAAPYVLGQALLDDGVRVYAHVRGLAPDASAPRRIQVAFAGDGDGLPLFWLEPA